jgi:hypothetical protein
MESMNYLIISSGDAANAHSAAPSSAAADQAHTRVNVARAQLQQATLAMQTLQAQTAVRATECLRTLGLSSEGSSWNVCADLHQALADAAKVAAEARQAFARALREEYEVQQVLIAEDSIAHAAVSATAAEVRGLTEMLEGLNARADCQVCMESCKKTDGVFCEGGPGESGRDEATMAPHFLCGGCFVDCVNSQSGDSIAELAKRGGLIWCPFRSSGCRAGPYVNSTVARLASPAAFAAYERAKARVLESQLTAKLEHDYDQRVDQEVKVRERLTAREIAVMTARKHITNSMLTLKCPRCGMAWDDFDGCCALKCKYCSCAFCAYCTADCGTNAHEHVQTCQYGKGAGYHGHGMLPAAHKRLRTERVQEYLPTLAPEVRKDALQLCQKAFAEVGLRVQDF